MKLIGISDIHGYLIPYQKLARDFFDVLCICGDIVPLEIQSNINKSEKWFKKDFQKWCEEAPCKKVIFIAGNHDFYLERILQRLGNSDEVMKYLGYSDKIIFLHDSLYKIKEEKEFTFYGSPWISGIPGWAFYKKSNEISKIFEKIPNCDVLLTHTPGKHVFDTGRIMQFGYGEDVGSDELTNALKEKHIGLWLCGHIHSGNHKISEISDSEHPEYKMKVANVSVKDERYQFTYPPLSIDL